MYLHFAAAGGFGSKGKSMTAKRSTAPRQRKNGRTALPRPRRVPRILLLVETARAYGRRVVEGVARYALENGPWSIQFEERELESSPPEWLKEWRGDGIISRTTSVKLAKMLAATRLPLVELFSDPRIGIAQVKTDSLLDGRMAVEHFINCGLRQFAYFTYGEIWATKVQQAAFCQALKERGFNAHIYPSPTSDWILPVWHERYRPRLIKWLRSLPRPIGIYAATDLYAVRLMDVCRELDVAVPEEMAILGVGNDPVICETVRPTLSSLDLDARRIGYEAARLLDQKMAGKAVRDTIDIPPSHVAIRQSTDHLVVDDPDVVQALRFIREYACSGIDVDRVAVQIGLSRSVLERRFRRYLGCTPKEEIMRIQIDHAKMLLARTDRTIESIVHKSGFHSRVYFTRAFHRETGMTPHAYRQLRWQSSDFHKAEE
jgi:LacI family transcriptional regulator